MANVFWENFLYRSLAWRKFRFLLQLLVSREKKNRLEKGLPLTGRFIRRGPRMSLKCFRLWLVPLTLIVCGSSQRVRRARAKFIEVRRGELLTTSVSA